MESVLTRLLRVPGIVCPVCHAALCLELPETARCTGCARAYAAHEGLPVLLRAGAVTGSR